MIDQERARAKRDAAAKIRRAKMEEQRKAAEIEKQKKLDAYNKLSEAEKEKIKQQEEAKEKDRKEQIEKEKKRVIDERNAVEAKKVTDLLERKLANFPNFLSRKDEEIGPPIPPYVKPKGYPSRTNTLEHHDMRVRERNTKIK